jgi:ribonuclease Z
VLTHVSNRYFGPEVENEARTIFPDVVVPRDFDVVEVPYAERGAPRLLEKAVRPRRVVSARPEPVTVEERT